MQIVPEVVHELVGKSCPTCYVVSETGKLFWQTDGGFYECDKHDHYMDSQTAFRMYDLLMEVSPDGTVG